MLTDAQLIASLRAIIQPSTRAWAEAHGLAPAYVGHVLRGERPASERVLAAAGLGHLRRATVYLEPGE